jgi:hypothetical protein
MDGCFRAASFAIYARVLMNAELVNYLRNIAQQCIVLARNCPHTKTAHGLEALAVDLMAKALDIENALNRRD